MSYDSVEKSIADSKPYELFLFQGTGILYALTSGDTAEDYLGFHFVPASISRTEVDQSAEVSSGQIHVEINPDHPLAQLFIPYLPTSPVALTVFGAHVGDGAHAVLFSGEVSSATFKEQADLICNSDQYALQRKILQQLYQSPCVHIFGDPDCGVDLSTVTYPGVVNAISPDGLVITVPAWASLPHSLKAGFFRRGNDLRMIVDHVGDQVTLLAAMNGLEGGTLVLGTAGCRQTYDACEEYVNIENFLGFDKVPTVNPFDASLT